MGKNGIETVKKCLHFPENNDKMTKMIPLMMMSGQKFTHFSMCRCTEMRNYLSKHQDYVEKTEKLVLPILEKYGYELVEVEFVREAGSWYLRVYLDKEGGITIDDLTVVNHELSDALDQDDFISESYILEVSSPGLLRPFKKPRDFLKNLGEDVEVKFFSPVTWEENGKTYSDKEFVGVLKEYREEQGVVLLDFGERDMEVQLKDIAWIRKSIDF